MPSSTLQHLLLVTGSMGEEMLTTSVLHLPLGRCAGGHAWFVLQAGHSDPPAFQNEEICKIQMAIWKDTCSSALPCYCQSDPLSPASLPLPSHYPTSEAVLGCSWGPGQEQLPRCALTSSYNSILLEKERKPWDFRTLAQPRMLQPYPHTLHFL